MWGIEYLYYSTHAFKTRPHFVYQLTVSSQVVVLFLKFLPEVYVKGCALAVKQVHIENESFVWKEVFSAHNS